MIAMSIAVVTIGQNENVKLEEIKMGKTLNKYGIEGMQAPELVVDVWIDDEGNISEPVKLKT